MFNFIKKLSLLNKVTFRIQTSQSSSLLLLQGRRSKNIDSACTARACFPDIYPLVAIY